MMQINCVVEEEDSCKGIAKVVYEQYHEPGQLQRLGVSYEDEYQVLSKSPGVGEEGSCPCLLNFSEVNVRLGGMVFAVSGWATASQIACIIPPFIDAPEARHTRTGQKLFCHTLQAFPTCSSSLGLRDHHDGSSVGIMARVARLMEHIIMGMWNRRWDILIVRSRILVFQLHETSRYIDDDWNQQNSPYACALEDPHRT
jgi:hypothetical protein